MIEFSIVNDWGHGFTGNLSITNSTTSVIDDWTIEFDAPFEITNLWNGEIVSQNGNRYVIRNAAWNSEVEPNETISFGFNGKTSDGMTNEPTNYRLNNIDIQTEGPQPDPMADHSQEPASPAEPSMDEHNHGEEQNPPMDEHNHGEEHNHD
ncbi:MAG: cellulose binding domain-containing protein, partial [Cyanobacteria bacterium P01_D01_bin.105]